MTRRSIDVVKELLDEMTRIVRNYHNEVGRTGTSVENLIAGTAVYPGGSGLWRGDCYEGSLPEYFPDDPVMFVGHNFGSIKQESEAQERRGEIGSDFWKILKGYLKYADVEPEECFFTNALMGLKPGSPTGSMPSTRSYKRECREFLKTQEQIVCPRAIVALGQRARGYIEEAVIFAPWASSIGLGIQASCDTRERHRRSGERDQSVPRESRYVSAAKVVFSVAPDAFRLQYPPTSARSRR
jgi:hypothetical protein